ncbi:MAG: precorrin-6A reductase [Coriobacteriales bacterium]|jgi:precorrin-6x reductase
MKDVDFTGSGVRDAVARASEMLNSNPMENRRILLFGGTSEGRELALSLVMRGWRVMVSVATEVGAEQLPAGLDGLKIHVGPMDHSEMTSLMSSWFDFVVDATHPYAVNISQHVRESASEVGLDYVRIIRPSIDFNDCVTASSVEEACWMVPSDGGNVLGTTGNRDITSYTVIEDYRNRVHVRVLPEQQSIDSCHAVGIDDDHIIAAKGPFSIEQNLEAIDSRNIRYMITKESGTAGGFPEKLEAARMRDVKVVVVSRPQDEDGVLPDELLNILRDRM